MGTKLTNPDIASAVPGPVLTVRAEGRLDLAGYTRMRTMLLKALAEGPGALLVDLSGLQVIDEVHLAVFPAVLRQADAWPGCRVVLFGAAPEVAGALRVLRIGEHLTVCSTESQARVAAEQPAGVGAQVAHFASEPQAVAQARRLVETCCAQWAVPEPVTATARQICSELVANAVRHAHTPFELHLRCRTRYLHVAVRDFGTGDLAEVVARTGPPASGLAVVAVLAGGWGVTRTVDGKVVWATLSRSEPGRQSAVR
ncbi:ATP-binding protein [Catellatospora bangladeshensis]|uniref:ATP-binding protein n=1 Tax=Catellatospora bangladeshensis TaxID=310355 RepID=A0A8J3JGC3_9ACTN|nr:ATP-binding protein [Catellatospora bangladeshensis]GIF82139.1 ATP-binding protein [Catellatospora bangladeshensis]